MKDILDSIEENENENNGSAKLKLVKGMSNLELKLSESEQSLSGAETCVGLGNGSTLTSPFINKKNNRFEQSSEII